MLACGGLLPDRPVAAATHRSVAPYPDLPSGVAYRAWARRTSRSSRRGSALEGPEALLVFKERNWPIFRRRDRGRGAERSATSSTIVDRGALRGLSPMMFRRGTARVLLGLVRRRHGFVTAVGLRAGVSARSRSTSGRAATIGWSERPRRVACVPHPDRHPPPRSTTMGICSSPSTPWAGSSTSWSGARAYGTTAPWARVRLSGRHEPVRRGLTR